MDGNHDRAPIPDCKSCRLDLLTTLDLIFHSHVLCPNSCPQLDHAHLYQAPYRHAHLLDMIVSPDIFADILLALGCPLVRDLLSVSQAILLPSAVLTLVFDDPPAIAESIDIVFKSAAV